MERFLAGVCFGMVGIGALWLADAAWHKILRRLRRYARRCAVESRQQVPVCECVFELSKEGWTCAEPIAARAVPRKTQRKK